MKPFSEIEKQIEIIKGLAYGSGRYTPEDETELFGSDEYVDMENVPAMQRMGQSIPGMFTGEMAVL